MSGVDERVETVREALVQCPAHSMGLVPTTTCPACVSVQVAHRALDSLAAAVAGLEQRAEALDDRIRDALDVLTGSTIVAGHLRRIETATDILNGALAAAVVSAEPTEIVVAPDPSLENYIGLSQKEIRKRDVAAAGSAGNTEGES